MPTITGTLSDIGLEPLTGLSPVLRFTPSSPAVDREGRVFASKPVEVTPAPNGAFSVDLASTEGLSPVGAHWQVQVGWRNPTADGTGFSPTDALSHKLFVPTGGGRIGDLVAAHNPFGFVYVDESVPNESERSAQFQFDPVTGDLYERVV